MPRLFAFAALVFLIAVSGLVNVKILARTTAADDPAPEGTHTHTSPATLKAARKRSNENNAPVGRLINDPTLPWDEALRRPWLDPRLPEPPAMLLLTSYGWNHRNLTLGLTHHRSLLERRLYAALVNHPWFHPTGWDDLAAGTLEVRDDVRYYVFPDVNQCNDQNYPNYGGGPAKNADRGGGRALDPSDNYHPSKVTPCGASRLDEEILRARLFRRAGAAPDAPGAARARGEWAGDAAPATRRRTKSAKERKERKKELERGQGIRFDVDMLRARSPRGPDDDVLRDNARLVLLACVRFRGFTCPDGVRAGARRQTAWITSDGRRSSTYPDWGDQGLLHPPITPPRLTAAEERDVRTCAAERRRRFDVAYLGNFRSGRNNHPFLWRHGGARAAYREFHDGNRTIVAEGLTTQEEPGGKGVRYRTDLTYGEVLRTGRFLLAPRGDNKFSFRFAEVLAAGGIPVYHADDYLFPFRPEAVDWGRCAVILPERDAGARALRYLAALSAEERCRRRNYCYFGIYKRYVETFAGQVSGYVEGLEGFYRARREKRTVEYAGIRCNASSIAALDCNPV